MENISSYIPTFAVEQKPLTGREKRWVLQNEIFVLIKDDAALKKENWNRFVTWRKTISHNPRTTVQKDLERQWKREAKGSLKYIRPISNKRSLGFFTSHLDEEALWFVKSVVQDKLNRGESPTCYIYSLNKYEARGS